MSKIFIINKSRIISFIIIFIIPLLFFFWNFNKYYGPVFIGDEIGYLSNAILISGYHVDGGSSYHSGFSFLLAPIFILFDDTASIWRGIMFVNSLLLIGGLYFVNKLIYFWDSEVSVYRSKLVLFLVSIYPTWVTMSGYAFTTLAFMALFMLSLVLFIRIIRSGGEKIYLFTVSVGLLYWVHPIGLMAYLSSIAALGVWTLQERRSFHIFIFHFVLCTILIFLYKYILHPCVLEAMTPHGHTPHIHYPSVSSILKGFNSIGFWIQFGATVVGQFSYLLVSTFGICLFGVYNLFLCLKNKEYTIDSRRKAQAGVYFLGTLVGVVFLGAVNFSLMEPIGKRIDHWIYGRYLDSVCIPLLAISLLIFMKSNWRRRVCLIPNCLFIVLLSGLFIYIIGDVYTFHTSKTIINIASFWPQYIFPDVKEFGVLMLLGATGIALVYIFGKFGLLSIPAVFVMGLNYQTAYHSRMMTGNSASPTAIVDIIRKNYQRGAYISFDQDSSKEKSLFHRERFSVYKYYLYDYRYQRVSKEGWGSDCSDLILTYDPCKYEDIGVEIARESRSGLSFMKKKSDSPLYISETDSSYGLILKTDSDAVLPNFFTLDAEQIIKSSDVGTLKNGRIISNGQGGYVFFGPYISLPKGEYKLTIWGDFSESNSAILDIVSNSGKRVFLREKLSDLDSPLEEIDFKFYIEEDIYNLEVRLRVTAEDRLSIDRYIIRRNTAKDNMDE